MPSIDENVTGSAIQEFFRGATVFITGGTGFMGKVLVEKLLRSCPDISEIILLVRSKKDKSCQERLDLIFDNVLFKGIDLKCRQKVSLVNGDCSLPELGLSEFDRISLVNKVDVAFHAAATVRFDEALHLAVAINIQGTKVVLDLARQMSKLKAFVHVSTAYSNCHLSEIEEIFYPPYYNSDKMMALVHCLEKQYIDQLIPTLLKDAPNTYVYTKCIAEDVIRNSSKGLPVAVFRPSIIVSTKHEPIPGWIDNLYGPTGVMAGCSRGLLRSLHCRKEAIDDIVPVDMVINALIATAWQVHNRSDKGEPTIPKIYNYVSSPENPLYWSEFVLYCMRHIKSTVHAVWYPSLTLHKTAICHRIQLFLQLFVPAWIIDVMARLIGKHTNVVRLARKIEKFTNLISYFPTRQWKFHNNNVRELWESLNSKDRELFPFSMREHDWESYFKTYMLGIRQYVLKDDLSTLNEGQAWVNKLFWADTFVKSIFMFFICTTMWSLFKKNHSSI